jgi:hypothetical protein
MLTAEKFNSLGAGNGFPSCLSKVDVSAYDNVEPMTLQEAMKIFWNLASISYNVRASGDYLDISISGPSTSPMEPKDRTCVDMQRFNPVPFPDESYVETPMPDFAPIYADVSFDFDSIEIKRLYDGDTTNEENFIGYGIERLCYLRAQYVDEWAAGQAIKKVSIHNYVDDDTDSTITTVSIGGVTFLKKTVDIFEGNIGPDNATVVAELTDFDFYTYT